MKIPCFRILVLILITTLFSACHPQLEEQEKSKSRESQTVTRYGWVIQVKAEKLDEYKRLHANPWPEVDSMIKACNIRNYSIYYRDGLLFSYLEYTGDDFEADMEELYHLD